jgi:hypothetical protein
MILVQSVIRRSQILEEDYKILCIQVGRIHGRTCGCKESLLKVRKRKYKGKNGEAQVEARSQDSMFLLFRCFKNLQ